MTGPVDYLSDDPLAILNGHHLLGKINGPGCALGSTAASYLAVHKKDKLLAVLAAILHYEIVAECVARQAEGLGTFIPTFLD
jgi:thiamine-phosphate diphosphorylase/hydroxyethylthiazole kinase